MLPAFSRSQSVQSPAHVRLAPPHAGLRLDSGRLFKGAEETSRGSPVKNTSGRGDEGFRLSAINAIPREYHA